MNRETRTRVGRCNVCGVRCAAWFCVGCSFDSDYWSARQSDDYRAATATSVARAHQRLIGASVEHEQVRFVASRALYRGFRPQTEPRFSRKELIRWATKLAEVDPEYRAMVLHSRRRAEIAARWSAPRRFQRFCEQWSSVGLQLIADHFTGQRRAS